MKQLDSNLEYALTRVKIFALPCERTYLKINNTCSCILVTYATRKVTFVYANSRLKDSGVCRK